MRYFGGKGIVGKRISIEIMKLIKNPNEVIYIEPFCGALGVMRHISRYFKICYANDICKDLIMLHKLVKTNKFNNPKITKQKWLEYKYSNKSSAERAFAGFGCSYGGVWFNGYIDDPLNNDMIYSSLKKIHPKIQNVNFYNYDYIEFIKNIKYDKKQQYVIYMDPPYKNTCNLPWEKESKFDSDKFWEIVRILSKHKNITILVSEVSAPSDFKSIYSFSRKNGMHNNTNKIEIIENIYMIK